MARILIIEDNPENMQLMVYLLTAFGHTVLETTTGEPGLTLARTEAPDLILCDLHMPGMDGYEVAQRLKLDLKLAAVPLVAVTAYAMVGDREKVLTAGFNGYISKPINPESFVGEIEMFLSPKARSKMKD
jgi:two-component system cell cycle response regulator